MARLEECDPALIRLFMEVVTGFDCTVIEGHRPEAKQNEMVELGRSQLEWPKSKHNQEPSQAVDVAPYPVDWEDRERFIFFGGYVKGIADSMKIGIRWGGDWDHDTQVKDNRFDDLPHFELYSSA
jgi:peptidoglycan L-alanyl-D-glutamate endopeptidase CwlK